jgi:hypothetical protein
MPQNKLAPTSANALDLAVQNQFGLMPNQDRLSILPRYSRQTGWVAPDILYQAARGFVAPSVAAQGYALTAEDALNTAGAAMGGGAFGTAPKNALRMMIGRNAKTWDKATNATAQQMEKQGFSAEEIWAKTGNFRGPGGEWRQEISDAAAKFRTNFDASAASKANDYKGGIEGPVGGMLTHKELYEAYPELLRTDRMTLTKLPDWLPNSAESGMNSRTFSGKGKTEVRAKTEPAALDLTTHELQHAIQNLENFPAGGTEAMFGFGDEAFNKYRLLAGEAEARATAARRNLTDTERRALFPYRSYDVPVNKLIIRK